MIILDGGKIAGKIKAGVAHQVRALGALGIHPGLAMILVGSSPAADMYVRNKIRACEQLGIHHQVCALPSTVSDDELCSTIVELNGNDDIDGVIVELPLPHHLDRDRVLLAVDPHKDVDGFHPVNVGLLATWRPGLVPCTAAGVMELLRHYNISIAGREAVVVGRSDIVGKPVAMMLLNQNATVTICHAQTRNLAEVCRRADILVAALGRPGTITLDFVKPGATVIDVGINKVADRDLFAKLFAGMAEKEAEFEQKGWALAGDVHPQVAKVAGALTPVPGGVGPLTIAMLMVNTMTACRKRRHL